MRRTNKYHKFLFFSKKRINYTKFFKLDRKFQDLKKSKWDFSKNFFLKRSFKNLAINNLNYKVKSFRFGWFFLKKKFREKLLSKINLNLYFDNNFKKSYWKRSFSYDKNCLKKNLFLFFLISPEFRLNIFLWRLQIFKSPYESALAIKNKKVVIKGKVLSKNYLLKKGDIIQILKSPSVNFNSLKKITPFYEYDYYTRTFIILYNWYDLSIKNFYFSYNQHFDLKSYQSFLK